MKKCPRCKSTEWVREFIYGMPDKEPDESKYILAGCLISEDMPDYRCIKCSTDYYKNNNKTQNRFISDDLSGISLQPPL